MIAQHGPVSAFVPGPVLTTKLDLSLSIETSTNAGVKPGLAWPRVLQSRAMPGPSLGPWLFPLCETIRIFDREIRQLTYLKYYYIIKMVLCVFRKDQQAALPEKA